MLTSERGGIFVSFVGDPSAAGQEAVLSCQFSVKAVVNQDHWVDENPRGLRSFRTDD